MVGDRAERKEGGGSPEAMPQAASPTPSQGEPSGGDQFGKTAPGAEGGAPRKGRGPRSPPTPREARRTLSEGRRTPRPGGERGTGEERKEGQGGRR